MTNSGIQKSAKIIPKHFKADMAAALWEGIKTETRRVVEPVESAVDFAPDDLAEFDAAGLVTVEEHGRVFVFKVPYVVGALMPVREPWRAAAKRDAFKPSKLPKYGNIRYEASPNEGQDHWFGRSRSPLHLPYRFTRMVLEVTGISVERLQSISEASAKAEGVKLPVNQNGKPILEMGPGPVAVDYLEKRGWQPGETVADRTAWTFNQAWTYRLHYAALWDRINAARGYPWKSNPWVAAVRFKRHKANILTFRKEGA